MSLQPSSHPKARSLIVFLLFVISLRSLLTQFTDLKARSATSHAVAWSKGSGFGLRAHVQAKLGSHFQHQLSKLRHDKTTNEMKAVLDCRWWEHLSNWILKFAPCHVDLSKQPSSLLPIKAVFPFSHYKIFVASYFTTLPPFFSLQWFRGGTKWNSQVRAVHAFENHSPVFYGQSRLWC